MTVYRPLPYGTSDELVAGQISQRLQVIKAIGDKEKMRFPQIIRLKIMEKRVLLHSKLLLADTNPENKIRNEDEFTFP